MLPQWITGLRNACEELEEQSERRCRSSQLDSEDESEFDSEDGPVVNARGSNEHLSLLSSAERNRREVARARMRMRNGSEFPVDE